MVLPCPAGFRLGFQFGSQGRFRALLLLETATPAIRTRKAENILRGRDSVVRVLYCLTHFVAVFQDSNMNQPPAPQASQARRRAYWRANSRLILCLLSIWALVSLGAGILWVETLNQFQIGRLPLGFWFAQQGSIYVFVVLVFVYAWSMDRLDRKFQSKAADQD